MDAVLPLPVAVPACGAAAKSSRPCPVCPRLEAEFEAWRQAAFYRSLHERAVQREQHLRQENEALRARIRSLEQRSFGRKRDSPPTLADRAFAPAGPEPPVRRRRGQQPGRPCPQRRRYDHLPAVEERQTLPADKQHCRQCGRPFASFPGTEDSTVLEVFVRAHRRIIRRQRYRPTCRCGCNPGLITAPAPPKLLPKSLLGLSIWVTVLLDKYLFYRPTERLCHELALHGLDLAPGTLSDGLQRLVPLFEPLYEALIERSRQQKLWHADETRWLVFATVEGKVGYRWYLWVFHAAEVVVFVLASGRGHDVPEEYLGPVEEGFLVVDRYAAYKILAQVKEGRIRLAFCWAHVRRDFLEVARSWSELQPWALAWVQAIGELYQHNDARLAVRADPVAFAAADQQVRAQITTLAQGAAAQLHEPKLHPAQRKTLLSLQEHWAGLTVFVDHPDVPMDNNTAERAQRGPVVGRKNYYGSGAVWSGQLAAMLFSLFQTLALADLNPRFWLTAYLEACAAAGGQAPADAVAYLPWNLTPQQKQAWCSDPGRFDTS